MNEWLMNSMQAFIIRKIRKDFETKPSTKKRYFILETNEEKWVNKHYVALASMINISTSMIKRLFKYPGHTRPRSLTARTMEKLVIFLEYDSWD